VTVKQPVPSDDRLVLPRRRLLTLAGALGATSLVAACSGTPAASATSTGSTSPANAAANSTSSSVAATDTASATISAAASAATTTSDLAASSGAAAIPTPVAPVLASADGITIYNYGGKLPAADVTVKWMDNGGAKAAFFKTYAVVYHQGHPNITLSYEAVPTQQMSQAVELGVQNGNAPDILQLPTGVTAAQAVAQGWVAALDDIVPNFAQWKAAFPAGVLQEGSTVFNGKTYSFRANGSARQYNTLTLFNVKYMQAAGYDPVKQPLTWDEFRAAAKKITTAGKGQYFGLVLGGQQAPTWGNIVSNLATMAGAAGGEMNWKTGQYNYTSDQYLAVIDLLLALKSDGSVYPGSLSLALQAAASRMPAGVAGMLLDGVYDVAIWRVQNPSFQFDVASQPVPNSRQYTPLSYGAEGGTFWVYAKSPNKAVAGDMFAYLGSPVGQLAFQNLSGAPQASIYPAVNAHVQDQRSRRIFDLYAQQMRRAPDPTLRNPDVARVLLEQHAVQPAFGQTVQGIYTGQLANAKQAMQDLQNRMEAELDRAIKAAQAKGAKVSRDDWKFANWDPAKDYTASDYQALPAG
jgi:multiple sugar transport system substrate-binding protein